MPALKVDTVVFSCCDWGTLVSVELKELEAHMFLTLWYCRLLGLVVWFSLRQRKVSLRFLWQVGFKSVFLNWNIDCPFVVSQVTAVGFEPTPLRNTTWTYRLRPLGHAVSGGSTKFASITRSYRFYPFAVIKSICRFAKFGERKIEDKKI